MGDKSDVWQGTLAPMVLRTLERTGAQHGYCIARRIEQDKQPQEGNFYELTKAGHRRLKRTATEWRQTQDIVARFLAPIRD